MGGAGGVGDGLPMVSRVGWEELGGWGWVAGLVCRVCLCEIWVGGAGRGLEMGCQWLAGLVSRVCL